MANALLWVTDYNGLLQSVAFGRNGEPRVIELHNLSMKAKFVGAFDNIALWISEGVLPWNEGYVRLTSRRYQEWQILIDESIASPELKKREEVLLEEWKKYLPPAVEKPADQQPTAILKREHLNPGQANPPERGEEWFISAAVEKVADEMEGRIYVKDGGELFAEELAEELPTDIAESINVDKVPIGCEENTPEEIKQMREILRPNIDIFKDSGDAAPPQVKGVLCDIDVGDARPVRQRARRIRPEFLGKLHVLLKALLKGRLIKFSTSPWASPIVIVRKKNGEDIRLCIDYRLVNALTKLMWASMPAIDELLENFDAVMWMCSFDACSGFWSVGMTARASNISAFICQLGHFQWLRMPQGLKNAPQIYQRMLDNAIWRFVRPRGGWDCEATDNNEDGTEGDIFSHGEPDDSHPGPVFLRRSYIDDIAFGTRTWNECCETLARFLKRMKQCGVSLSLPKSQFGQRRIDFLSHCVSTEGIEAKPKDLPGLKALLFPTTKKDCSGSSGR